MRSAFCTLVEVLHVHGRVSMDHATLRGVFGDGLLTIMASAADEWLPNDNLVAQVFATLNGEFSANMLLLSADHRSAGKYFTHHIT